MSALCPTCGNRFEGGTFCEIDGTRLVSGPDDDRSGSTIAQRYRLLRLVGEGAMGQVYEAEHTYIHKRVALKLLHSHVAKNQEVIRRFHQEARATSAISHPNIVKVEDFGSDSDGSVFLAMEWLEGETLEEFLEREEPTSAFAMQIVKDMCAGLKVAHDSGVIHRDLKPANIFLAKVEDGRMCVKVLDFGIAKLLSGSSELTGAGTFIGTPHYMAPEQALAGEIDRRADIYALGVVLYRLLSGHLPFTADSPVAVLHMHTAQIPVPPSQRTEQTIESAAEAIVLRCLQKNPDDRYASASELSDAITAAQAASGSPDIQGWNRGESPQPAPFPSPDVHAEKYDNDSYLDLPAIHRRHPLVYVIPVLLVGVAVGAFLLLNNSDKSSTEKTAIDRTNSSDGGASRREPAILDAASASNNGDSAMPVMDAGTKSRTTDSAVPDSGSAVPDSGLHLATPADQWTYSGKTADFAFKVIAPTSISIKNKVTIEVQIRPTRSDLQTAMANNSMKASVKFSHYKSHSHGQKISGKQQKNSMIFVARFERNGKHHVSLVLGQGTKTSKARFDVCVGANRALCPSMN